MGASKRKEFADFVEEAYRKARDERAAYGMSRLRLGMLLYSVKENGLWEGKATSFWAYVDDLRLNRSAIGSYMRVAEKFIVQLNVSERILRQLANCHMGVLERAAAVITAENADEVIAMVLALHKRDALAALGELASGDEASRKPDAVSRVLSRYMELTDDGRIEFMHRIQRGAAGRQQRAAAGA